MLIERPIKVWKRLTVDYLFVVRHGETKANEKGIEAGPLDYPLAKKGVKEASFIAKTLAGIKFKGVYSSPVFRAVQTAKILARPHKLKVKTLEELTEAKIKPEFVGKKGRHHMLENPDAYTETNSELLARTAKAIDIIKKEASGHVIVVSHGDVITALLEDVVERKLSTERYYVLHPDPASLSVIDVRNRPSLAIYNFRRKMFSQF
jgi:alpha-ribazole phosphatase/probable phosphoglycerate mutase